MRGQSDDTPKLADQFPQAHVSNLYTVHLTCKSSIDIRRDNPIHALRILAAKSKKIPWIEVPSRPLAFDGIRSSSSASDDEVNLVPVLVSPVVDLLRL